MKKLFTYFLALCSISCFAGGPYAPAAGKDGSTAIYKDSAIFKSWATGIEVKRGPINVSDLSASHNGSSLASFGLPNYALGKAQDSAFHVVSLGDGGSATLTFDKTVKNGKGPDFAIFENSFSDDYLELAFVEVSSDGEKFVRFPAISLTQNTSQIGGFATLDPTDINNLAGKYRLAYGTPFDLEDIKDSSGIDLNNVRFIRIIDVVGSIDKKYGSMDSKGNIINDPFPTAFYSGGFDLDAVGVINAANKFSIATFDDLTLEKDSFWNGADRKGSFSSGIAYFKNSFDTSWGSWSGFAYSNMQNDSTAGWNNQYSAITKGGITGSGTNFVLAYYSSFGENSISFTDSLEHVVNGMYLTNSTYAYFSMKEGDAFSKKFGGSSGTDPDFLKVQFWGEKADSIFTDTVDFYLADFRSNDNSLDYIVNSWKWVDLAKLGNVKKIHFQMISTDNGDWGMNTPSYFCIDNFSVQTDELEPVKVKSVNPFALKVYPNPFTKSVTISGETNSTMYLYDISGHLVLQRRIQSSQESINLEQLSKGIYFLKVSGKKGNKLEKIIKN